MNNKTYLLKASSLINAIFVCVIISVFSGCFILISHYQNLLSDKLYLQEALILRNESALNYFLNRSDLVSFNKAQEINVFDDGLTSLIEKKNWGFYDVLICKTIFKNDTVVKTALVGNIRGELVNNLALYVTNYDKPLKLSGKTKVLGDVNIPNGRFENAYINGRKGNILNLKGTQSKSKDKLPKIDKEIRLDISGLPRLSLNNLKKEGVLINEFEDVTQVIDVSGINLLKDINCKGNFILYSLNELEIDSSAILNDIVIMAPIVNIKSGFKGNVQIIANQKVIVEDHVALLYPSSIYIKNDMDEVYVEINDNSTLIGGVVIDGNAYINSLNRSLYISEKATIVGNVYCQGSTQLKGAIVGSIYTDRFFLKTSASSYENIILNASIDQNLPDNFVELPLFSNSFDKTRYAVIKEL